jgi:hypothetical protein
MENQEIFFTIQGGTKKMSQMRQQILILHLANPDLGSRTVAWAIYDGAKKADELQMNTGDSNEPPYGSVLAAMREGWNVIQIAHLPKYIPGHEHETGHLPFEYVLERKVTIDG